MEDRQHTSGDRSTAGARRSAQDAADEVISKAKATAGQLKDEVVEQARLTSRRLGEQTKASLEEGKEQIAKQLGSVAKAFSRGSQELRDEQLGALAEQGEWLAAEIGQLEDYLRHRNVDGLLDDARQLARSRPALFLGGVFMMGFIAARFAQSSTTSHGSESTHRSSA